MHLVCVRVVACAMTLWEGQRRGCCPWGVGVLGWLGVCSRGGLLWPVAGCSEKFVAGFGVSGSIRG